MTSLLRNGFKQIKCDKITAIFFDLDNTLIVTRKGDSRACSKLTEILQDQHGMTRDSAVSTTSSYLTSFRRCPDNPDVPLHKWRLQLWFEVLPDTHKHIAQEIYNIWLDLRYRYLAISPDVISMLQTLRLQYLLGLITNGPSNAQWEKIDKLSLTKYFDCILVSSDLPWAKPDRNIFYAACNYLGVQPQECVMVGDKLETDIQGGIEAKLGATVWLPLAIDLRTVDDLMDLEEKNVRPDFIIEKVTELQHILPKSTSFRRARPSITQTKSTRGTTVSRCVPSIPDSDSCNSNSSDGSS